MKMFRRLTSAFLAAALAAAAAGITAFADAAGASDGGQTFYAGGYEEPRFIDQYGNEIIPNYKSDSIVVPMASATSSYYNLADEGRVASYVKDQSATNTCWAHAALASGESSMITKGYADTSVNYSVGHLAWFVNGPGITDATDPLYGDVRNQSTAKGAYEALGSPYDAIGALASWTGAELESRFPFSKALQYNYPAESMRYDSYAHLQNAVTFDASDRTSIKNALVNNGALTISFHTPENETEYYSYYNSNTAAYMSAVTSSNHAVTLVGWDDNFSRTNFNSANRPASNGAWICKNSYGADYGKNGIFYISYEEPSVRSIFCYDMEKTNNYNHNYQYDGAVGVTTNDNGSFYNFYSAKVDWTTANVYTSVDGSKLSAVGFYTIQADTQYKVSVITGVSTDPSTGTVVSSQTGRMTYAGFHTVKLSTPVQLKKGEKFAVAISVFGSGSSYRYQAFDGYSPSTGLTYLTTSTTLDSSTEWGDCYTQFGTSACIKAYTTAAAEAPANLKAAAGNGRVTLTWDAVDGATNYAVLMKSGSAWTTLGTSGKNTAYTAAGLTNGQKYYFAVKAYAGGSWSAASGAVAATPVYNIVPQNVKASAGDGKVTLTWDKVDGATNYAVFLRKGTAWLKIGTTGTGTAFTSRGLPNGGKYFYMIKSYVDGAWSGESATVSAIPRCITPQNVKAFAGDGKVTLTWDKVDGASNYAIFLRKGSAWLKIGSSGASTTFTSRGLPNGGKYYYIVKAYVDGAWSDESAVVSASPVCTTPQNVTATGGRNCVELSWDAVSGAAKYAVLMKNGTSWTTAGTVTENSCTVTGLANEVTYTFAIKAYANGYWSDASAEATATTLASEHGTPVLTAKAGDGKVTLSWTAVDGALYYVVGQYLPSTGTVKLIEQYDSSTLSAVITTNYSGTALSNGTTYYLTVIAFFNEDGNDYNMSEIVDVTPRADIDTERVAPVLSAAAGDREVTLSWTLVPDALYYKVYRVVDTDTAQGYIIELSKAGSATGEFTVNAEVLGYELINDTQYSFMVMAVFSEDETDYKCSNTVNVTPVAAPEFTNFTAAAGDGQVTLTWDTPSTSSSTHFVYIYTGSLNGSTSVKTVRGTSYTATGLTNGTKYGFKVETYVSAAGKTISSDVIWATPSASSSVVREAPVLDVEWGIAGALSSLSWSAPSGALSYKVYSVTGDDSMELVKTTTSASATFPKLTNGTEYRFVVFAYFDSAETIYTVSNSVSVIPSAYSDTEYQNIVAVAGDGKVTLSWYAPYVMYSTPTHSAYYFAAEDGVSSKKLGAAKQGSGGETMTVTISGLTNGVKYGFYVTYFHPTNRTDITSATVYAAPQAV